MLRIELAAGKNFNYAGAVKFNLRNPFFIFGLVLLWRVALLVFTAQPIPANDAFFFDGPVVNLLLHGHYFNPAVAEVLPISGGQVYSAYPPLYQGVLLVWMTFFGTSVIAAMALHLALFAGSGWLTLAIVKKLFPPATNYALAGLLFLGITFGDRPDDLGHALGLVALFLVAQNISGHGGWKTAAGLALVLLGALYSSVVVGAFYFGAGFLTVAFAWLTQRKPALFVPFIAAAALFAVVTAGIITFEPLWWHGFLENSRQTPVRTVGIRVPHTMEIIKLLRTAPVFLLAAGILPFVIRHRQRFAREPWLALFAGVFLMGGMMLLAAMTVVAPDYVSYVLFAQIILAAGLLALVEMVFPAGRRRFQILILGCAALMSLRAVGMTTWGAACAWKNSCGRTHETLRVELEPFAKTNAPVILSSPYLYGALELGVQHPIHSDWFYNHATATAQSDVEALKRLRPPKLVLTQFDYYRAFAPLVERLRQQPALVAIQVRNLALVRPPDAIPALSRVVQHISWAPVIVDLEWK